jgi:glucose-fructose oxidoreductase
MGNPKKIRYAVVGLGHIAQVAVLPAFAHAAVNSELVALVSNDPVKRKKLAQKYNVIQ